MSGGPGAGAGAPPGGRTMLGKRVIVTGGAVGIGAAIARAFHRLGAEVGILDLDGERAEATAKAISEAARQTDSTAQQNGFATKQNGSAADPDGAIVRAGQVDVSRRASVEQAFPAMIEALGGLDILAANAGVSTMRAAIDLTDRDWDFNFDVNARGVFLTNQAACRYFLANGRTGAIVNTASLAGKVGAPLLAHYSASKFAVLGWTQALAREMAPKGIRVNAVCPGFVKTSMQDRELIWEAELRGMTPEAVFAEYVSLTPLGRIEEPEDVADVVTFLASDQARFMTGQGVNVTGGVRMD